MHLLADPTARSPQSVEAAQRPLNGRVAAFVAKGKCSIKQKSGRANTRALQTIDAAMKYVERGVSAGIAPRAIRNRNTAKIRSKTIAGRSEIAPYP